MAEKPKAVMLNGGKDVSVTLVADADAFLSQLLAGASTKTGAAALRVVKNASGVPFVAVIIARKHVGFLSHADAECLLPVLADCEERGSVAAAKAVLAVTTDGTATPVLKLDLASPNRPLAAPTSAPVTAAPQQSAAAPVRPVPRPSAAPATLTTSPVSASLGQAPRPAQFAKTLPKKQGRWARQSSRNKLLLVAGAVVVLLVVIVASAMSGGARDLAGATRGLAGPAATVISSSSTTVSETSVAPMEAVAESTQTEQSSSTEATASVTTTGRTSTTTAGQATTTTTVKPTTSTTMATTTTVAATVVDEDIIVYRTDTGKKYHRAGCQHLAKSKHAITLAEAKALGLGPCGTCHPPE
ncbi:MAG: hypothetical protein GX630_06920 [Actinobacteria bacterium]|nr:hypothetical protein [Actinomycetota bacterium]